MARTKSPAWLIARYRSTSAKAALLRNDNEAWADNDEARKEYDAWSRDVYKPEQMSLSLPVELSLEESGILCHTLLGKLIESNINVDGIPTDQFAKRMIQLYNKLTEANDILMGKIKP